MKSKWIGISAAGLCLLSVVFYHFYNADFLAPKVELVEAEAPIEEVPAELLYGLDVSNFNIIEGKVAKNQTLATILGPFNVPYQVIDQIAKKSKEIFDVRKIATNRKFTILTPADSLQAQFFIYEPNATEYVVFDLDSEDIYLAEKPVELQQREVAGYISTSLYVDMINKNITPDLIDLFADLYGWSVDFQRLQKGDKYKVIYEEKVIDGEVVGISDIKLALFEHLGETYHAIPFEQNGEWNFFDQEGNSLKKAFLRDPLKYSRISSRYSLKRFHPVQKRYKAHLGTDYAAARGTEIRAVGDGTITHATFARANGNYVKIKHNGTYTTQYLHMSKIAKGVKAGTRVKQGQVIGYVGSTGLATGPHLCFRFWKHGKQVDWLREKIPPSEPILPDNQLAFETIRMQSLNQLASIPFPEEKGKLLAKKPEEANSSISSD